MGVHATQAANSDERTASHVPEAVCSVPWSHLPEIVQSVLEELHIGPGTQVYFGKRDPIDRCNRDRAIVSEYVAMLAANGGRKNVAKRELAAKHGLNVRHIRRILARHSQ